MDPTLEIRLAAAGHHSSCKGVRYPREANKEECKDEMPVVLHLFMFEACTSSFAPFDSL